MSDDRQVATVATTHVYVLKDVVDSYQGDEYVVKDGELVKLFAWEDSDDRYIPQSSGTLLLYREHLDGPIIKKDVAKQMFPEYFI